LSSFAALTPTTPSLAGNLRFPCDPSLEHNSYFDTWFANIFSLKGRGRRGTIGSLQGRGRRGQSSEAAQPLGAIGALRETVGFPTR